MLARQIFSRLKDTSKDILRLLDTGDTVTLVTFADSARLYPTIMIHGYEERIRLSRLLDDLEVNGEWTYIAEALNVGLGEAERLERSFPTHSKMILVLTDAFDDPPPRLSMKPLNFREVAKPYFGKPWYVYQVKYSAVGGQLQEVIEKTFPQGKAVSEYQAVEHAEKSILTMRSTAFRPWRLEPTAISIILSKAREPVGGSVRLKLAHDFTVPTLRVQILREQIPKDIALDYVLSETDAGMTLTLRATTDRILESARFEGLVQVNSVATERTPYVTDKFDIPLVIQLERAMIRPSWLILLSGTGLMVATFLYLKRRTRQPLSPNELRSLVGADAYLAYGFVSGIAISASTNLMTSTIGQTTKTHYALTGFWFVSGLLFFFATLSATRLQKRVSSLRDQPEDVKPEAARVRYLVTFGIVTFVWAITLLLLNHIGCGTK